MSDVSAIVLSLGEPATQRALASLTTQTYPLHEVIVVENVSPFFRAFNEGASRVTTPFFIQVDADMVLDPRCVEELRAAIADDAGTAYGELRDPLMGQVVGIKIFRTECVRQNAFRDSISPDTDFKESIRRTGWKNIYAGLPAAGSDARPRAFGEHLPDYTPSYAFAKYVLEGRRYRYRGDRPGLFWQMERLEASNHALAVFVRIALSHGFFLPTERDELKPFTSDARAGWLADLLASETRHDSALEGLREVRSHGHLGSIFRAFVRAGQELAQAHAGVTTRETLHELCGTQRDWPTLVAKLGLGHGLLIGTAERARIAADEQALRSFVLLGIGRRVTPWENLRAHALETAHRLRRDQTSARW